MTAPPPSAPAPRPKKLGEWFGDPGRRIVDGTELVIDGIGLLLTQEGRASEFETGAGTSGS